MLIVISFLYLNLLTITNHKIAKDQYKFSYKRSKSKVTLNHNKSSFPFLFLIFNNFKALSAHFVLYTLNIQ